MSPPKFTADRDAHMALVREWKLVDLIGALNCVFDSTGAIEVVCQFLDELRLAKGPNSMSESPTFVATFEDGEVTRMTIYQAHAGFALARGVRLSIHAYCSRKKTDKAPRIVEAQYVDGETGAVLKTYGAKELNNAS